MTITKSTLKEIIEHMPGLPTMPTLVVELLGMIKDPSVSVSRLSTIISKDISFTTEILKIVNTSYYGFPSQITTINKAVALLGLNKLKSLLMSAVLKSMLQAGNKNLWEHSLKCAIGCEILASSLGMDDPDEAFTMGLLHDIGKTVLEVSNKKAYKEVNRLVGLGADRLNAEKMFFGFDHAEAGAELVKKWKLPVIISTCAKFHHSPQSSDIPSVVGVVYVIERVIQEPLNYPILDSDIINALDFDLPDPLELRDIILQKTNMITCNLLK